MDGGCVFTVRVGWTSSRPIRPDEHVSWLRLTAESEAEAVIAAAQQVQSTGATMTRPRCVMVTSARVTVVEV
jgi:hypothetical protein